MKADSYNLIKKSELFNGIMENELSGLIKCIGSRMLSYKKNEYIVIENDKFEEIGIVLSGEIAVIKENFIGTRTIVASFKSGDLFGEINAFSGNTNWPASVLAQTNCEILFINPNKIIGICEKICDSHRILMKNITKIISKKVLILNKKVEYLSIKSIKGKLAKYILEQYKKEANLIFSIPLNREELADFLNVSRPSMSRELCKMRDEGIIEFYLKTMKIKDIKKLEECLERIPIID